MIMREPLKIGLRQRQRQERDEAILSAAFMLIAEKGYEAMTMEELADRIGISKPTLYHHFPSKQVIAVRAAVGLVTQATETVRQTDLDLSPGERLEAVVRVMLTETLSTECLVFMQAKPLLMADVENDPDFLDAFANLSGEIENLFIAAQDSGEVDSRLSAKLLTQMLFTLMHGDSYQKMIACDQVSAKEIIDSLLAVFFHGIRTAPL
jgi:AcrR family transcriptional regulator